MICCMQNIMCMLVIFTLIFFFKQKTAYEMRISDWSSDVCSSDLSSAESESFSPIIKSLSSLAGGLDRANLGDFGHVIFEQLLDAVLQRRGRGRATRAAALQLEEDLPLVEPAIDHEFARPTRRDKVFLYMSIPRVI